MEGPGAGVDRTSAPSRPKGAGRGPRSLFGRLGHARGLGRAAAIGGRPGHAFRLSPTARSAPHPDRQREVPVPDQTRVAEAARSRSEIDPRARVLACRARQGRSDSGGRFQGSAAQTAEPIRWGEILGGASDGDTKPAATQAPPELDLPAARLLEPPEDGPLRPDGDADDPRCLVDGQGVARQAERRHAGGHRQHGTRVRGRHLAPRGDGHTARPARG